MKVDELPTNEETTKYIEQLKNGKAPKSSRIPPEIWKNGVPDLHTKLNEFLVAGNRANYSMMQLPLPYTRTKGGKFNCYKYWGITPFLMAGKIISRILLERVVPIITEKHLLDSQCFFRVIRRTIDIVLFLGHSKRRAGSKKRKLYVTFIDLLKEFHRRKECGRLWNNLAVSKSS